MASEREQLVDVTVRLVRETDASWLVEDDDGTSAWLPKSKVDFAFGSQPGQVVTLEVPAWLAEDRELV